MRTVVCLITFLLIARWAISQSAPSIVELNNINDVWALALKNNPDKKVYDLNVEKAKADHKVSESFLYPSASASFGGQDNLKIAVTPIPGVIFNQPGKTIYAEFGKHYVYNTGVTISRPFFDWQAFAQAQLAKNNIALNEAQADAFAQNLKQQTAQYYFNALIAKAAVALSNKDLQLTDSIVVITRQRLADGLTDSLSLNQAVINYNDVVQNNIQSRQLLNESLQNLHWLLGMKDNEVLEIKQDIDINSFSQLSNASLGMDKNLQVYPFQIKSAELNTKVQKAALAPTFSMSAYLGDQQFRDDFGLGFGSGAWNPYQYIGLNINVPIFTGFAAKNRIKSAQISQGVSMQQYRSAQMQSAANDSITLSRVSEDVALSTSSSQNFMLYASNASLTKQKFDEGLISLDVYLKSIQDYLNAENTHLNNLSALYSNYSIILARQ